MLKHLKNQNGASFLLIVIVMSSMIIATLMTVGYKIFEWDQTTADYQRKIDAMAAFETLASELKEAHATGQIGACPGGIRDLAAAPASNFDFDMNNNGAIDGAVENGINNNFCFPDPFCIPHPNPGTLNVDDIGGNSSMICFTPVGGANRYDNIKRIDLKNTYVMNFKIRPPKNLWARVKYEAVATMNSFYEKTQNVFKSLDSTAVASILVNRPVNAVGSFTTLNRALPACPLTSAGGPGGVGVNNIRCKSCDNNNNGNLACVTFQVCLHPRNCGGLADTSAAENQGWFKQVIGVKLTN